MKSYKLLIFMLFCVLAFSANAQSSCEKLFSSGVKLQQTMTIPSQNKAIYYFERAKICFDSQAKKDLCDQQIKACRNIIAQLTKKDRDRKSKTKKIETIVVEDTAANVPEVQVQEKRDVQLSVDCVYLKFKGKGGEFKKVKVSCNYSDWKITEKPEWVNCSINDDGDIIVEPDKNPKREERSGSVKIECDDKSASFTVIQEKAKKLGIF